MEINARSQVGACKNWDQLDPSAVWQFVFDFRGCPKPSLQRACCENLLCFYSLAQPNWFELLKYPPEKLKWKSCLSPHTVDVLVFHNRMDSRSKMYTGKVKPMPELNISIFNNRASLRVPVLNTVLETSRFGSFVAVLGFTRYGDRH